jgi:hypothetical protein
MLNRDQSMVSSSQAANVGFRPASASAPNSSASSTSSSGMF